jgi:hypothetical protein
MREKKEEGKNNMFNNDDENKVKVTKNQLYTAETRPAKLRFRLNRLMV